MRQHEYTAMQQTRISLFRMDFSTKIRDKDGTEQLVLIEQKEQVIEQKNKMMQEMVHMLMQAGVSIESIASRLSLSTQEVKDLI